MRYLSTRGRAPTLDFEQATLAGLAADGGLYVPEAWPAFDADEIRALRSLDYAQLAHLIIARFTGECIDAGNLARLTADAYRNFPHPAVAPLAQLDSSTYLLELFHGPTLAFKDFALQFLGRLFGHF
ncbi:MAG: threonine synthase, partial [Gammaproteobacteria bacterium]|nr:threonine synthase [Gammaproteobacteria bacterium]